MSQKYRQHGYQDSDRRGSPDRPRVRENLTTEERIQRKSLRHATTREANEVIRCPDCGGNIASFGEIGLESRCPSCGSMLHTCRTCRHFDSGARWQCKAEIDAPVTDKSKVNQCSSYDPRLVLDTTGRRSNTPQGPSGPREQFENLFKR